MKKNFYSFLIEPNLKFYYNMRCNQIELKWIELSQFGQRLVDFDFSFILFLIQKRKHFLW